MAPFQFRQLIGLLLCVGFAWCELGTFWGNFSLRFLKYASPYPCHSTPEMEFRTMEIALFVKSASG